MFATGSDTSAAAAEPTAATSMVLLAGFIGVSGMMRMAETLTLALATLRVKVNLTPLCPRSCMKRPRRSLKQL